MNDRDLEQFEARLRGLPLRRPSAGLDRGLDALWQAQPRLRRSWRWMGLAAASLAVAAGLLWAIPRLQPARPAGPAQEIASAAPSDTSGEGVHIERTWLTQSGDELIVRAGAPPVQSLQRRVVRQVERIDSRQQVRVQWIIPSEETVLVPLQYN